MKDNIDLNKFGHDILCNLIDYKICITRYYLSKIREQVPLNFDKDHFALEANVESFLFFANSGIENIAFNINRHFSDVIPRAKYSIQTLERSSSSTKNVVTISGDGIWFDGLTIYSLKKALDLSDKNQKAIGQIIDNYFSKPIEGYPNQYDFTKSSLWVLRELRNYVSHNPILGRHLVRGSFDLTTFLLRVDYEYYEKEQPKNNLPEKIGTKFAMIEDRPHDYFEHLYQKLINFVDDICKVIPQICPTFHYKTLQDSELQSLLS